MKAYLFSVGESTTDLAKWSLERQGFEVILYENSVTSLHRKYLKFLEDAKDEEIVLRCDADVVVTRGLQKLVSFVKESKGLYWWATGKSFCFLRMDLIDTAPNVMTNEAIQIGLKRMKDFKNESRPETALCRVQEFCNPRRFMATNFFVGLHGYKQREKDIERVMIQKEERNQLDQWDFDLIEKLKEI